MWLLLLAGLVIPSTNTFHPRHIEPQSPHTHHQTYYDPTWFSYYNNPYNQHTTHQLQPQSHSQSNVINNNKNISQTNRICDEPIDLNTASISELDALPFVTPSSAQLIIDIRPLCSPLELSAAPKKIRGINVKRLNKNWNWFKGQPCSSKTCCKANAVCKVHKKGRTADSSIVYSWVAGDWDTCTSECGKGTQHRDVKCHNSFNIANINDKYCATLDEKPLSKRVCNTDPCPWYEWNPDKWDECVSKSDNNICIQQRKLKCYDTANNKLHEDTKCDHGKTPDTEQECACKLPSTSRRLLWIGDTTVGGVTVAAHLLNEYNSEQCNTNMYKNIDDKQKTLITRRACTIYIYVHITGMNSKIDVSWFYLDATLQAKVNEIDNDVWNDNYLSWIPNDNDDDDVTDGWLAIALPNDGNIGEFLCNLYYQKNGLADSRTKIAGFTLYVLFNPYNNHDAVYMESSIDRDEYVENEFGLIWVGNKDDNSAMKWKFDQFHFPNLVISMNLLDRLKLRYRNNIVVISRQISFAVGADVCYGKWGKGPYTSGHPSGGYQCDPSEKNCIEPWAWSGTTQLFDIYRDVLKYNYKAQYCQCFVYAGVSTTVGRALGIPTRPTSNFQSAHDTDFNRAIESYWIYNKQSRTYKKTKGESSDSVWNFHVWNEMFFKRSDFKLAAYNTAGWQAIDGTPQERSYGGNPALREGAGAYQMGPAALSLIRENINTHQCKDAASNKERFGCFDTEFVISETNANYNFWSKSSGEPASSKFTLLKSFQVDPWDSKWGTIGCLTATKKPKARVSADCLNEAIRDCDDDYLDLTLVYKKTEPSDPGKPTDDRNHYNKGDKRHRRLLWAETNYTHAELEDEGIEYDILTIPNKESRSPMIVADDPDDIVSLYGNDYTFGMMSLNIDSFEDNELDVYCSVTATAHDYSGEQFGEIIKNNIFKFKLAAGQSSDLCQLYLHYSDYSSWVHTNFRTFDSAEIAYIFRFTITASIYDRKVSDTEAMDIIIEERDILVCWPEYKLRDRIMCAHQLDWFQPESDSKYECDDNVNIGDGFCDDNNNYEGCYDGGDCCKLTCIPSKNYKCPYFNCIDPRIKVKNEKYEKCPHISSFINYINNLTESGVCNNVFTDECPNPNTDNECFDHILAIKDLFDDDIESCYSEAVYSVIHQNIIQPIIEFVIDCMTQQQLTNIGVWLDKLDDKLESQDEAYNEYHNIFDYDLYDNYMYYSDKYGNIYDQYYNSATNDNYFGSFIGYELILLIVFVICFVCFVAGGMVGIFVLMSNRDDNKNQTYPISNDEQSTV